MNKKVFLGLSLILIFAGGLCVFSMNTKKYDPDSYDLSLGSANSLAGRTMIVSVFADEMLHAFGAPDLYYADSEYAISDEFVEYIRTNMPNDIMFFCSDITSGEYVYDRITNDLSPLDAYYVGLTQDCSLVDEYKLGKSQH